MHQGVSKEGKPGADGLKRSAGGKNAFRHCVLHRRKGVTEARRIKNQVKDKGTGNDRKTTGDKKRGNYR